MNPSTSHWIDKYIFLLQKDKVVFTEITPDEFYTILRKTGFIYGHSMTPVFETITTDYTLTQEELTKINLLHALFYFHFNKYPSSSYESAVESILQFYQHFIPPKRNLFHRLRRPPKKTMQLEKILGKRVVQIHINEHSLFEKIMSDALLFMDLLTYNKFLEKHEDIITYADALEYQIIYHCFLALRTKKNKSKDDLQLLELFQQSESYFDNRIVRYDLLSDTLEKKYILDSTALGVWNDLQLEPGEKEFLEILTLQLQLHPSIATETSEALQQFVKKYGPQLRLFQYKNPVKELYRESTQLVKLQILRNKKRLSKELGNNKELMVLLGKSTFSSLSKDEKTIVKNQLLEIIKSIPSLAIFLLPGGSLLLPILVKLIPEILPNTFRDNQIPKK
jgi:hypothetical protein